MFRLKTKRYSTRELSSEIISAAEDHYVFKEHFELLKEGFVDSIWKIK